MSTPYHIPALLQPTVDALDIQPSGRYADATFGGGGHSRAIMERLGPDGHLYGFDRDIDARANAPQDARFTFVHGDFRYMRNFLDYLGALPVQGIVADLGVSFHHFDEAERGFSFRADAPLDMRMNQSAPRTAAHLLADIPQKVSITKDFFQNSLFNFQGPARDIRGYSSAGRAPALQAGGQRFDPAYLHHEKQQLFNNGLRNNEPKPIWAYSSAG